MHTHNIISARDTASVLIVDDLHSDTELLDALFKSADFRILKSTHPGEAIDIFETSQPDIAVIDVAMRGINGFRLCRISKDMAGRRFFPVILLAAHSDRGKQDKRT